MAVKRGENLTLRWESAKKRRYYVAHVQRDLLGDLVLMCCWGGIGTRLGGASTRTLANPKAARTAIEEIKETRRKHHYLPV